MLDLNVASPDEKAAAEKLQEASGSARVDDSGTSISSVLNAEGSSTATGDEGSCSVAPPAAAFRFGILKEGGDDDGTEEVEQGGGFVAEFEEKNGINCGAASPQSEFVTRQLFPPVAVLWDGSGDGDAPRPAMAPVGLSSSAASRPDWMDLSFCQAAGTVGLPKLKTVRQPPPPQQQQVKKNRRGPRSRSSQYRGVTFYRRTGRWESHIWDCGKQVYLGGFDTAHAAATAYDRAAIKFRGVDADINFNLSDYDDDLTQTRDLTKEEFVHILRRQSTGFSRGTSKYRGVTLHKCGRWEARMGQFLGKKAYDKAAIQCNGREAITNFEPNTYEGETVSGMDIEVTGYNLDLNLSISQPVAHTPKGDDNRTGIHFQTGYFEAPDHRNFRSENSALLMASQSYHPAMTPENPPVWSAPYPGFFPKMEERTVEKRPEVGSPALPNWAWQMQGSSPLPVFSSAASSGFSTATVTAAALAPHPPPPPATSHHHHHQFPPTATTPHLYFRS